MVYKLSIQEKILAKARAVNARGNYKFELSSNIDILNEFHKQKNFTIVYMPFGDKIDGFSCRRKNHYIIVLNSKNNINRQNFTCAHELYHLLYEYNENDEYVPAKNSEELADTFASYFLIPEDALIKYLMKNGIVINRKITLEDIVNVENYFQVSRKAMLNRLRDLGIITAEEQVRYSHDVIKSVRKAGGDISKYTEPINPKIEVVGEMKSLVNKLVDENKISNGKYEEYLFDMFEDLEEN